MNPQPLLSICIPVFNGASAVQRCIQSVLAQSVETLEILVVDNCSTDETVERARTALANDVRAHVIVNERNLGRIGNWNRCLEGAKGNFVKLLMVNDVLFRDSLSLQLRATQEASDVVMVTSQHQLWDGSSDAVPRVAADCPRRVFRGTEAAAALRDGFDPFWALNGMIFRREAAVSGSLKFCPDIAYTADKLFCTELSTRGSTIHLQTPTYLFNTGAAGRFHFSGLEPRRFLEENESVFRAVDRILKPGGGRSVPMNKRLADAFLWWYDNAPVRPSLSSCLRLLRRRPIVQARALLGLARRSRVAALSRRWLRGVE